MLTPTLFLRHSAFLSPSPSSSSTSLLLQRLANRNNCAVDDYRPQTSARLERSLSGSSYRLPSHTSYGLDNFLTMARKKPVGRQMSLD
jgi:hypothetical protein